MAKFKLGDIFGIPTSRGKAYFQCVYSNKLEGELIKVFNNVFEQPLESIEELLNVEDFFFVGFPLKAALNRKIVEKLRPPGRSVPVDVGTVGGARQIVAGREDKGTLDRKVFQGGERGDPHLGADGGQAGSHADQTLEV